MLKRSKISLLAFISVSLVIIILISLYPDFFVNAEDLFNSVEVLDISESSFQRSDFDSSSSGIVSNENVISTYQNCYNNNFSPSSGVYNNDWNRYITNNDLSKYYCYSNSSGNSLYLGAIDESAFIVCNQNEFRVYTEVVFPSLYSNVNGVELTFNSSGVNSSWDGWHYDSSQNIDGTKYIYKTASNLVSSNLPMYFYNGVNWGFTSLDDLTDMNNPILDNGSDSDVFPDGSGGSPANNLYLDSPDFHFNNKKYTPPYSDVINSGDTVPNGTISFNCNLNDFQTANASNFNLEFSYKLIYDVDYKNHYPTDFGPFKKTSQLLNNKKNLNIPFISGETSVPLTDFINSDNTYSVSFADVFSQLNYDSYNLTGLLTQSREVSSIEYNKFDLYCNVRLVSQGAKSNLFSEWYNPISKKGYLVSDAITDNNNPYVVNPDQQADSDPDSSNINPDVSVPGTAGSGDSTSSSSSNNNVVVNNYNTNNNNNNNNLQNDNSTPWLINKLFGDGTVQNGAIGDNRVESLTETTGANNWIEVMKQSFSFVPVGFFNQLQLFFGICLGIFVVAFILRIILDLL